MNSSQSTENATKQRLQAVIPLKIAVSVNHASTPLNEKNGHFSWYKQKNDERFKFELTFEQKAAKDKFIIAHPWKYFLHSYNIAHQPHSTDTVQNGKKNLSRTKKLRTLDGNVQGCLKAKLNSNHDFMKLIMIPALLVILIKKHQLSTTKLKEFCKTTRTWSYELTSYSKAIKRYREAGGTGGIVTWIKTTILNKYRCTIIMNTPSSPPN